MFGLPNTAAFTDTDGFHAWTFTLTGTATVDVATEIGDENLDTVMYLYRRTTPGAAWGDPVERNDDADANTSASRLKLELAAAEYRVLVKTYKRTQRGPFGVTAACTGAGCPPTLACEPAVPLPAATGYGGACGTRIASLYEWSITKASSTATLALQDRCNAPALQRKAIDYYASYFATGSGELAPDTMVTVETRELAGPNNNGGTVINVSDGGAASGMSLLFDNTGELVLLYQNSQTPDVKFFCKEPTAQVATVPNQEACIAALVGAAPHTADLETDAALTSSINNVPATVGAEVLGPMKLYAAKQALSNFSTIIVDGGTWAAGTDKASRLTLLSTNKPKVAYLATSALVLIESVPGGVGRLVCE